MIINREYESSIPIMPCVDCVVMAICNAIMHEPEDHVGINALHVYRRCPTIKDYIDEYHVTQIDKQTWKTSFMCIQVFFIKNYNTNPHVVSDQVPLK